MSKGRKGLHLYDQVRYNSIDVNPIVLDSIVERIRNFTEGIRRQNKSSKLIFYGDYKNNNSSQLLSVSLQHIYPIIQKDECLRELYFNCFPLVSS